MFIIVNYVLLLVYNFYHYGIYHSYRLLAVYPTSMDRFAKYIGSP